MSGASRVCVCGRRVADFSSSFDIQPERIQGAQYTVKSDVWSLGISLIELALGRFPFSDDADDSDLSDFESTLSPSRPGDIAISAAERERREKKKKRKSRGVSLQGGGMTMSILELLQHIVNEPAPRLTPEGRFPKEAEDFVDSCLLKDPLKRRTPKDLLVRIHPICRRAEDTDPDGGTESSMDRPLTKERARPRGMGIDVLKLLSILLSSKLWVLT